MNVTLQLGTATARLDLAHSRIFAGRDGQACGLAHVDPTLSRRHAEIWLENGQTYLRDLGSSNGTWVDGQMAGADPIALRPGQQVYLGHVPLGLTWQGAAGVGGATAMMQAPPELLRLIEARKQQIAAGTFAAPAAPASASAVMAAAPAVSPGVGAGGAAAPLPSEFAYRRQGANGNGVLLIALRGDTFSNGATVDGFLEFTATDNETVACITIELVEHHKKGPSDGHVWDRVLVRQGPWRTKKGDVLPLPFQLRVPPGTSISGRDVHWELRGQVDINWASDIDATSPITMRNTDIERIRDALGGLDYRIVELESRPLGQRFEGLFQPPANLRSQLGINDIQLAVEYLGTNLQVRMHVDKKGMFKRDRTVEQVFDLARLRAAPMAEVSAFIKQQIDDIMAM
ncbi:MAG: FHA domain-containing protein [Kofleriaceae bacterium]